MIKIYHAQGWQNYSNWIKDHMIVSNFKDADLLLIEGGTDVYAGRYGETPGSNNEIPNHKRDDEEIALFQKAVIRNIPILGICRGSQLCCVMNKGRLVQDQNNPKYIHPITTSTCAIIPITSTHHQAQYPYDMPLSDYKLLAWTEGMCFPHLDGSDKEISDQPFKEAEIVYYPKTRALAIQGHPESMSRKNHPETFGYLDSLIDKLMNNAF